MRKKSLYGIAAMGVLMLGPTIGYAQEADVATPEVKLQATTNNQTANETNEATDKATLTVSTFEELRSALADDNDITTVLFANDIELAGGIRINANKPKVEIDGQGFTLTENSSSTGSSTANIYINDTNGTRDLTLKNVNIVGKNYYGTIMISDSVPDVQYNIENVTYTGPQFIYNSLGYCNFSGENDFTVQSSPGTATMNEFAQASGVTIEGKFNLQFNTTGGYSAFWFGHDARRQPIFNVLDDADVTIVSPSRQIFYTGDKLNMNIGKNANLNISTVQPLFDLGYMGNLVIEENGNFNVERSDTNWLSYPTLRVDGLLQVFDSATLSIKNAPETTANVLSTTANSTVRFDTPALVDLSTHGNGKAIAFANTSFAFNSDNVNEWVGNETDTPSTSIQSLDAVLAINNTNKRVIYSNQPDAFDTLSITNANRLQFTK